ncbi:MAG: fatty acid desaturase [Paracoccaceae bacterium]
MRLQNTVIEWPTLLVFLVTYATLAIATTSAYALSPSLGIILATLAVAQFSSLQHEVLHGHPFANQTLNDALVFPGITLFVPYLRFRDTHLAHHNDPILTDPYDDPEANYLDPAVWHALPSRTQRMLRINNTLLGRIVFGPAISTWSFGKADLKAIRAGDTSIRNAWLLHGVGVALVAAWLLTMATMPLWAYVIAAYLGYGLLKIRTFLEHRAHITARARTVIVEDRGPLALLFLNNNLHVVHHMHPTTAWYKLPALYAANKDHYQRRNDAYLYRNYAEIFRKHFLRAKDPVPHPLWPFK